MTRTKAGRDASRPAFLPAAFFRDERQYIPPMPPSPGIAGAPFYSLGPPIRGYDLSLDAKRFLMVKLDQRTPYPATELTLVQNWVEELTSQVPSVR
jgi:hypothetical protein